MTDDQTSPSPFAARLAALATENATHTERADELRAEITRLEGLLRQAIDGQTATHRAHAEIMALVGDFQALGEKTEKPILALVRPDGAPLTPAANGQNQGAETPDPAAAENNEPAAT